MARPPFAPERASPVTRGAPHIRGFWNAERIVLMQVAALLPPLGLATYKGGLAFLAVLAVALAAAAVWQVAFARWRQDAFPMSGLVTGLIVAVMVPAAAPLWQVALAVSFAVVVGEQIFGGYGRNFVNSAGLALAFLMFSFPDSGYAGAGVPGWVAVAPGALLLMALGFVNFRIVLAAFAGAAAFAWAGTGMLILDPLLSGSFAFAVVFIAGDPVCAPSTNGGRWVYGLAIGLFVALGAGGGAASARTVVFACLIGSIFAPLIDQAAVWINHGLRRRRHGRA